MNAEAWVALVAVIISVGALTISTVLSVKALRQARRTNDLSAVMAAAAETSAQAAIEQTALQRDQTALQQAINRQASEPYVWVDIRPDTGSAQLAMLVVGNSGPTVATDVVIEFSPPLRNVPLERDAAHKAEERLIRGLSSLPPGRTLEWLVGNAYDVYGRDWPGPEGFDVTVRANGPHGALEPLHYRIAMDDVRHNRAVPPGTLHTVSRSVNELVKEVQKSRELQDRAVRHREERDAYRDERAATQGRLARRRASRRGRTSS